ncbi:MAG TPA: AbrB family transcriptional regulator [Candidatus Limnocylindria bacterium]|jgi:putative addiction module antidote|nr:AbrB family transcriptional regulator [Candidatus Limnocylindria bacterium]
MQAELKVRKIGNSLGILLPKEAVTELRVDEGASLYLSKAPDGRFYLSQFDPEFVRQMEIAKEGMRRYRNTLKELAK